MLSIFAFFDISESDGVWEAWLTTINLVILLKYSGEYKVACGMNIVENNIRKVFNIARKHLIDENGPCFCGLSDAEHSLLKRKILRYYRLQVEKLRFHDDLHLDR